jgi:hypothetical protein
MLWGSFDDTHVELPASRYQTVPEPKLPQSHLVLVLPQQPLLVFVLEMTFQPPPNLLFLLAMAALPNNTPGYELFSQTVPSKDTPQQRTDTGSTRPICPWWSGTRRRLLGDVSKKKNNTLQR